MAVMGWWRPFTNENVLFLHLKNREKLQAQGKHKEFHFNSSVATLIMR